LKLYLQPCQLFSIIDLMNGHPFWVRLLKLNLRRFICNKNRIWNAGAASPPDRPLPDCAIARSATAPSGLRASTPWQDELLK
jgi:hypothetical protein